MFLRWPKFQIPKKLTDLPLQLVSDGSISDPRINRGGLVPVALVDTSSRPDIEVLIRSHQNLPPGDAATSWMMIIGRPEIICLSIEFIRPSAITFCISFDLSKHGIVVDQAIFAKAVYIQIARPGDKLSTTMLESRAESIFVEIGAEGFAETWEKIWSKSLFQEFRTTGLSRTASKSAADQYIKRRREFYRYNFGTA
jgi:hypothetical protein